MDKEAELRIIGRFREELEKGGVPVEQIVLFGSHNTGRQRPDGDIDLIVVSRAFENKDTWERIDLMVPALVALMEPIESIAATPEEWEAKDRTILHLAREGQVIYAG